MSGESTWIVGFRTMEPGKTLECFYVVNGAVDGAEAYQTAVELAKRDDATGADGEPHNWRVQVQQIVPDMLGNLQLTLPAICSVAMTP